jgi:ferredoxin
VLVVPHVRGVLPDGRHPQIRQRRRNGSCRDVCPENAIELLDEVRPAYLLEGAVHRYAMAPRPVELGTAQQMVDTMRLRMRGSDIFER